MQVPEGISAEMIRRVLNAACGAGIELVLFDARLGTYPNTSLDPHLATLWLTDRDRFWMEYHGIGPGLYAAWKAHMERADQRGMVNVCRDEGGAAVPQRVPDAARRALYDSAVDDHCKQHREAYSDLRTGRPPTHRAVLERALRRRATKRVRDTHIREVRWGAASRM
jgi:hypothetical protein